MNEGESLSLNCTADGNPTPNITWTRLSNNSVVTMPLTINRHSEGGYRCIAENNVNLDTADVFVTVQCKWHKVILGKVIETTTSPCVS